MMSNFLLRGGIAAAFRRLPVPDPGLAAFFFQVSDHE